MGRTPFSRRKGGTQPVCLLSEIGPQAPKLATQIMPSALAWLHTCGLIFRKSSGCSNGLSAPALDKMAGVHHVRFETPSHHSHFKMAIC